MYTNIKMFDSNTTQEGYAAPHETQMSSGMMNKVIQILFSVYFRIFFLV